MCSLSWSSREIFVSLLILSGAGHFLLTNLLLDNMKKTARDSHREGRIVNVSSELHKVPYSEGIRFNRINDSEGYVLA